MADADADKNSEHNRGVTPLLNTLNMIFIIVAPPRSGKTYFATHLAVKELKHIGTRKGYNRIYSNYPILDHKTRKSTFKWEKQYSYENIQDSMIIIDEAYTQYSSRNYKKFTEDDHAFFALNGHNGNDIYIIAQNAARVDVIIREMCNEMYYIRKTTLPFSDRPLWFWVHTYQDLNEMAKMTPDPFLAVKRRPMLFRKRVSKAYDTHYFRKPGEETFNPVLWSELITNPDETIQTDTEQP